MSTKVLLTITPEHIDRHRFTLLRWVEANGIDSKLVPIDQPITVEQVGDRTVICYRECQLSAEGNKLVDPDRPDQVLTVRRATDQRVPLATVVINQLVADIAVATSAHARPMHLIIEPAGDGQVRVTRLPDGGLMIAEEHTLSAEQVAAVAAARGAGSAERVLVWSTATEGDQTPGG